jgi:hypothetical protein
MKEVGLLKQDVCGGRDDDFDGYLTILDCICSLNLAVSSSVSIVRV